MIVDMTILYTSLYFITQTISIQLLSGRNCKLKPHSTKSYVVVAFPQIREMLELE